jgi:SET domain-containing protein
MTKSKYKVGNFKLRVGKSATGKGLYAIEYIGKEIKTEDQENASGRYLFETGKGKMINGNIKENIARYINHCCKGNCEAEGPDGHVYIMALRNIKPGEELTYDYGKEYFDEFIKPVGCKCISCAKKK